MQLRKCKDEVMAACVVRRRVGLIETHQGNDAQQEIGKERPENQSADIHRGAPFTAPSATAACPTPIGSGPLLDRVKQGLRRRAYSRLMGGAGRISERACQGTDCTLAPAPGKAPESSNSWRSASAKLLADAIASVIIALAIQRDADREDTLL
jgi:hypothetical protein